MTAKRAEQTLEVLRNIPQNLEPYEAPTDGNQPSSIRQYLDIIVDGRWWIVGLTLAATALATAYVLIATPIYRTDVLVQVEDKKSGASFLADLAAPMSETSPADTEIEVLRSRMMIGAVVKELHLDIVTRIKRLPLFGEAIARRHRASEVAGPFLSPEFGWGGERVLVDRLDVPERLMNVPLDLTLEESGRYTLVEPERGVLLKGTVGTPATGNDVALFVSELRGHPGQKITITRRRHDDVVEGLQKKIKLTEKGRKTGIIQISLDGPSAAATSATLDALARAYVRQNVERRSAEAEKTLEFLQTQLPTLRKDVDAAEAELQAYRSRRGSVDVTLETQAALTRTVEIEKALAEARVEQAALRERFTTEHPVLAALGMKIARLEAERASLDARLRKLPESELQSARRVRDVKVANELYVAVLNKAQELKVVKEGTIGNVRILDAAIVPVRPVSPEKVRTVAIAFVLGLAAGFLAAFGRHSLADGIEDPDAVERLTSIPVSASVPHSEAQTASERRVLGDRTLVPLLATDDPKDLAIESLRSLRTSLQFALVEARNQVVAVGGPAPGVGKSFVAANLAHLLGEAGKRVLVVDADLRRGQIHRQFGLDRGPGLSDAITGAIAVADATRATRSPNVSAITTGSIPSNPAELLGSERFERLLAEVSPRFDVVLVDTPPVLAVTDAALVARHAGTTLLVLRAGKHPIREVIAALRQFGRSGVRIHGIVMNDVRLDRGLGRRSAYHYQYKYE